MRLVWLGSLLVLLLTAPYWLGLLSGLWHQRVYAGIVRRRGLWLLLQWPFRQVGRCPTIGNMLFIGMVTCGIWVTSEWLAWVTRPAEAPAPGGYTRFVNGLVEMPGAGQIRWKLGDTDAYILNDSQDALKCAVNQHGLFGSGAQPLIFRGATRQFTAETFRAGVYCGAISVIDSQSVGIRVGPAP